MKHSGCYQTRSSKGGEEEARSSKGEEDAYLGQTVDHETSLLSFITLSYWLVVQEVEKSSWDVYSAKKYQENLASKEAWIGIIVTIIHRSK